MYDKAKGRAGMMGVEQTEVWLREAGDRPASVVHELLRYFPSNSLEEVTAYLHQCGLNLNPVHAGKLLDALSDEQIWKTIERFFRKYQSDWNGIDIPIFILPHRKPDFLHGNNLKAGLAYPDKLILFFPPGLSMTEKEALFVHEYHHVCRINKQYKKMIDYTLLDTIMLEGTAEKTIEHLLGKEHLAPWVKMYDEQMLKRYWENHFKNKLATHNKEDLHNQLLFGKGRHPRMIGYCMGYLLAEKYYSKHAYSVEESLQLPADAFVEAWEG